VNSVVSSPDPYTAMSDLRARLQEAEDTLTAIRSRGVDAIVVNGPDGEKVFSLAGADRPYRLMIERMNQGAAMLREDGTIIFCNAAMASMLDSKPESVTGSNIHAYACLDMQETLNSVLEQGSKGNARRELHLRRMGGADVPALVAVSSLGRENAATLCLLATDLSEQKRRQEELETSHRQVSGYAAELQRSNQELGDFATVAGHDLQQPARKVCSLAGQLKAEWGDRLGDEGRRVVEHLAGSAERMHQLIDALLSYARIQTQNKALAAVNLQEVLSSILADLEVDIREAGARVQLGWLPEIVGDEKQLRQLFQNLISNALKYRRRDVVPEITVEARLFPPMSWRYWCGITALVSTCGCHFPALSTAGERSRMPGRRDGAGDLPKDHSPARRHHLRTQPDRHGQHVRGSPPRRHALATEARRAHCCRTIKKVR
jgi:PAS domain S-box-containing protein